MNSSNNYYEISLISIGEFSISVIRTLAEKIFPIDDESVSQCSLRSLWASGEVNIKIKGRDKS